MGNYVSHTFQGQRKLIGFIGKSLIRTEQNRTEQLTEQNRTEQNRTEQNRTEHIQKLYKSCSIKQIIFNKYGTNLKTTISHRSLRISG